MGLEAVGCCGCRQVRLGYRAWNYVGRGGRTHAEKRGRVPAAARQDSGFLWWCRMQVVWDGGVEMPAVLQDAGAAEVAGVGIDRKSVV